MTTDMSNERKIREVAEAVARLAIATERLAKQSADSLARQSAAEVRVAMEPLFLPPDEREAS